MTLEEFFAKRKMSANQYFGAPDGSGKTVLITSHIYWTDLIGFALIRLGYNVLFAMPWYMYWIDDAAYEAFDSAYSSWVRAIKENKIVCVIGGNTTAMMPHPRTGEPLHRAAGVPAIHYWWDEPRVPPPMAKRGITLAQYMAQIKDERTLNVIWDIDVMEEMEKFLGVGNSIHVPLATTPGFWHEPFVPLQNRTKAACFLGNCHQVPASRRAGFDPGAIAWAKTAIERKQADAQRPMVECAPSKEINTENEKALAADFERWAVLATLLMDTQRNAAVRSVATKLGTDFTLIGSNWETMGLKAQHTHSGVPGAKTYYASHKASLSLGGGVIHGGMPLRPFDISSSNGLIFTQTTRELPGLFEPDKECVAFTNEADMYDKLDRILSKPGDYNRVVGAGHRRTLQEHTWEKRMAVVMREANLRFGVPV